MKTSPMARMVSVFAARRWSPGWFFNFSYGVLIWKVMRSVMTAC